MCYHQCITFYKVQLYNRFASSIADVFIWLDFLNIEALRSSAERFCTCTTTDHPSQEA